jgi:peptidoglycan/xylan/chitin deacetylase (PgdA/CDA1 family)
MVLKRGGVTLMRSIGRCGVRILLYHRFPASAKASLEAQCAHLRRHYHVVSLDQVGRWLSNREILPNNSLAVTVDDGYRDFYLTAYPVFRSYGIPVTMFLTTDFLDAGSWLWVDRVKYACSHTPVPLAEIPFGRDDVREFRFATQEECQAAATEIKNRAKRMSNRERLRFVMEDLPHLLKVTVPVIPPEEYQPLRWDDVRGMAKCRISFGAHTKTHPILSSVEGRDDLIQEIHGSKKRIEEELDNPILHFAYPNGTWDDFSPQVVETVKTGSFQTAVIAMGGVNGKSTDPFMLRRNAVEASSPEMVFGRFATGFRGVRSEP